VSEILAVSSPLARILRLSNFNSAIIRVPSEADISFFPVGAEFSVNIQHPFNINLII
jgi:hypothetical protein